MRTVLNGLLKRSECSLTSSSLRTLFYEVMTIVNSRPLSVESLEDPSGPLPLTPNHILTQRTCGVLPPPGAFDTDDASIRKRWRRVQHLADAFWQRWRSEYLSTLQARRKWRHRSPNLSVGDVVLLKDDTVCRADWRLGKIESVFPSQDGLVRRCTVLVPRTHGNSSSSDKSHTLYERPVHKLVLILKKSDTLHENE